MRRAALTLLFMLIGLAAPGLASATTLYGKVNAAQQITLELDGADVEHLPAGIYTVIVTDSTSNHNFHLHGPGVDVATPVGNTTAVMETWIVTLTSGQYGFNCDRHPGTMWGSFTVGDVLSVTRTGSGSGTVTSLPLGITCGGTCFAAFPDTPSVTLTATPAGNSEFLGWSGACSGVVDCALAVSGYASVGAQFGKLPPPPPPPSEPPPPPAVTAPATVTRVTVRHKDGVRTVRITLAVKRHTGGKAALRRKGSTVVSKRLHVAPGTRIVVLKAPRSARAGAYRLRLTLTDSATGKRFVVTRTVRL